MFSNALSKFSNVDKLILPSFEVYEKLSDWSLDSGDDKNGDDHDHNFVEFGFDDPKRKWVVGIYHGAERVPSISVPSRSTKTLMATITKCCATESLIHTDGWEGVLSTA